MNREFPDDGEGWFASSVVALQLGAVPEALKFVGTALGIRPEEAAWRLHELRCLQAAGQLDQAVPGLRDLAGQASGDAALLGETGLLAGSMGEHALAEELFQECLDLDSGNARSHYNLAATQRYLGKLDEALAHVDRAIELNPLDHDAHYLRSSLKRWTLETNHVDALQSALDGIGGKPIAEAQLCYALAKELEDCEQHEASFQWLGQGAAVRRENMQYELREDLGFIEALIDVYDPEFLKAPSGGFESEEPLFVLGLPRTGTTLAERILGACEGVTSIGESTVFTRLVASAAQQVDPSPQASRSDLVRATAHIPFRQLGEEYVRRARPPQAGYTHFVDKFPGNSLNIGAIHKALPRARIVLLERHPMDTCYAMFKALFTDIYPFSYDLEELGQYFVAHQGLIQHWRHVLGDRIYTLRYETLVGETEDEARRLLDHCRLPWQPECLEFQRNPQASTTASASQVRQGIYTSSVGLWKKYREQLAPLEQRLREAGCLEGWTE